MDRHWLPADWHAAEAFRTAAVPSGLLRDFHLAGSTAGVSAGDPFANSQRRLSLRGIGIEVWLGLS
jgi:hypothetical protein